MKLFKYSITCKSGREFNVTTPNMERAKELVSTCIGNDDTIRNVKCLGREGIPKGTHDHTRKPYVNRTKDIGYQLKGSAGRGGCISPGGDYSTERNIFDLASRYRH